MSQERLLAGVSGRRLADDLWSLVAIPSPTGREREAALRYADMLRQAGAEVEVDEAIPASPSVVGRLRGSSAGRTLQLAGHIDHIDVPHEAPHRTERSISGRGAADMKNGLAAILEIVRILSREGGPFAGQILVTAYGLHEAPVGHSQGLAALLDRGVRGDAALVFEGAPDRAVICGKGQSIWHLWLEREGAACHEVTRPAGADELLRAALALARELDAEGARLRAASHAYPLLGPESVFVGQMHYGDFYNRAPRSCTLQGTWRWHPNTSFEAAQAALHAVVERTGVAPGIRVDERWTFVGESFSMDPEQPIVRCLRRAYERLRGKPLPLAGQSSILDTNRLVREAGVPSVPIDCHGESGHADREEVRLDLLEAGCRLGLLAALEYLEVTG